jgi:hypothetical protein
MTALDVYGSPRAWFYDELAEVPGIGRPGELVALPDLT